MVKFLDIIRGRESPGILIFDFNNRLLYSNKEICSLIPCIMATYDQTNRGSVAIFEEIFGLCDELKQVLILGNQDQTQKIAMSRTLIVDGAEQHLSLRAFVIHSYDRAIDKGSIMIMAERLVENHGWNFERIQKDFNFSSRELDVLRQVCVGLSNREMAEKLFISEHTVKDHLKNIMKKMKVSSRNEIMAALKV